MSDFVNTVDIVGDEALTASIVDRSITEIADNLVTSIGQYAFYGCSALTAADFPMVTSIGGRAFCSCSELTTADFPVATSIGQYAFQSCSKLTTVDFPAVTSISSSAFYGCSALTTADFPMATRIGSYAFRSCSNLTTLILRSETMCTLSGTNAFNNCYHILGTTNSTYNPDGLADGYIYVPRALVDSYKAASNWSTYANQFRALEDYTVDGTTTGALDESKI